MIFYFTDYLDCACIYTLFKLTPTPNLKIKKHIMSGLRHLGKNDLGAAETVLHILFMLPFLT